MNTKQLVKGTIAAMLLMAIWYVSVLWVKKSHPEWVYNVPPAAQTQPSATPTGPTTGSAGPATGAGPATNVGPESVPTTTTAPLAALRAVATGKPAVVYLGSAKKQDPTYAMQVTLDPRGAGIDQVVLNDFNRAVKDDRPYAFESSYDGHANDTKPLASRWVTVNGTTVDLSNVDWSVRVQEGNSVTYSVDLVGADEKPVARLTKTFHVPDRKAPGQGFEIDVQYAFENLSAAPLKVKAEFNGPTVPPMELVKGDRMVLVGRDAGKGAITPHQNPVEGFTMKEPTKELLFEDDGKNRAVWAGGSSAFFNAILLPLAPPDPEKPNEPAKPAEYLEGIKAQALDLTSDDDAHLHKVALTFQTKELTVNAGETLSLPMSAYFGPRRRETLNTAYFTQFPRSYYNTLVITSGPCSVCTFDWLINGLVKLLSIFHFIFKDWGLAIIALVVLVRCLLHPITKKSQVNMMKMGKMGPEIEKLKKKYGDDKDELNRQMMQFYKTQGATPILGCLPMFLQMPIWIALWSALQSTFELRHAPFLYGWTWINDLSHPDALLSWHPIKLFFGISIAGLNLLPLLLAVVFWINQKYTPKPPASTPEQEQQQKMMQWMTLLFPMFLYTGPSGLNLYILTSTTIGIIESKVIRDHIKQREALEKLTGPVIVDAPPTRGSRRKDRGDDLGSGGRGGKRGDKPSSGGGWLARLQNKVEDMKRTADRKGR